MGKELKVKDENGNEVVITVVDTFTLDEYPNKEYIAYFKGKLEGENVELYASILEEYDDSYSLIDISNSEEWNLVQEELNMIINKEVAE